MSHPLLDIKIIEQSPRSYLNEIGQIFSVFDEHMQDSGNISYGVQVEQQRYFVKTAGDPDDPRPYLSHPQRVAYLRNVICLRHHCDHASLPQLHNLIESPTGPLLIYTHVEGELLAAKPEMRQNPHSAYQRFRQLPVSDILNTLDLIYDLHHKLAQTGWIAVDFYDGCLIYDFTHQAMHIVDLDLYQQGPFINEMGRMFGSKRFMAPEEFERGALIDEQTNVFTMGRTAAVLLSDNTLTRSAFRGNEAHYEVISQACQDARQDRFASMSNFYDAWCATRP